MPPIAAVPLPPARSLPVGSCDAHAHVFGPFDVYPLARDTEGAYPLATRELHLAMLDRVGCTYGVLVHASQNGLDCSNMLDALDQAPERLRGIAVVEPATAAETLADMARRGVRGVRVTEMRLPDGSALPYAQDFATIAPLAATMRELGWHAELWAPCATIVARVPELLAHGIPLAIDHMAMVDVDRVLVARTLVRELEIDWPGVEVILRLVTELAAARRRIAELEREAAARPSRS